jgi:hypothetical protein
LKTSIFFKFYGVHSLNKFKKSYKNKQQYLHFKNSTLSKETTQNEVLKIQKKNEKKLNFNVQEFGIKASTCTKQEGEGKYHTKERNKSNTNVKRIITIVRKEQQTKVGPIGT